MKSKFCRLAFLSIIFMQQTWLPCSACTRALYVGDDNVVITGRTMDWKEDMHSNLWLFPRGIQRDGSAGPNSIKWKSKYGSVIVSGYDVGTADGMNEKGLVTNLLYLVESEYRQPSSEKPLLSISLWAQYVLDNFATVSDAVNALKDEPFYVIPANLPNNEPAQLHLSISDATGDSAIFEYIKGELIIHHGKQFTIQTNSPTYDQQLALNSYWEQIGGTVFLPGTNRSADRFARASFFINAIPKKVDSNFITAVPSQTFANQAVASVLSLMRSVSVPLGITTPNQPNIASTLWRTISNQKDLLYFFDSSTSPNTFWVAFKDLDIQEGAPVKKITTAGGKIYLGNASQEFKEEKPFTFLPAK
ncbi:MAG: hydrolase [Chlamydia sp. 32-24]|nr:MAG: hydrolase [Chlamydia sp. 32-24]